MREETDLILELLEHASLDIGVRENLVLKDKAQTQKQDVLDL